MLEARGGIGCHDSDSHVAQREALTGHISLGMYACTEVGPYKIQELARLFVKNLDIYR